MSSNATDLFSVQLGRGLSFETANSNENVWTGSDITHLGTKARRFLLESVAQSALGNTSQWLGGYLTSSGMASTRGAYAFSGPKIAVPLVMLTSEATDSGLALALNLNDKLSTRLCLNTSFGPVAGAVGFTYGVSPRFLPQMLEHPRAMVPRQLVVF